MNALATFVDHHPKDVGPPKAAGGGIEVLGLVGVAVVDAVICAPVERAVFEGARSEEGVKQAQRPRRFVAAVTEQTVVADGDAQPTSEVPDDEEDRLHPRHAKLRGVPPQPSDGSDGREHEKRVLTTLMLSFPLPDMVWWRTP